MKTASKISLITVLFTFFSFSQVFAFQAKENSSQQAAKKPRARDLGIPFDGKPGLFNAITDVKGVEVGHTTLISGEGKLVTGEGPVRTGVTAVLPQGKKYSTVFSGWYSLNGNGEMTGTIWVGESGVLGGPIMITNTHSVGIVRDAVVEWLVTEPIASGVSWALPVVAETYDGYLNDINGFHVKKEHAFSALNSASSGAVEEGGVGGGTGMICHQFKGGIGTSSRLVTIRGKTYTVGVLVQANYGGRRSFTVAGIPVGKEITDLTPGRVNGREDEKSTRDGSIIVIVATDAPLLPHQLKRLARRVPMGIARVGGLSSNGSGDIFIAFSTGNDGFSDKNDYSDVKMISNNFMSSLFSAVVYAVEESIINALVAGETMTGINGNTAYALPHDRLREILTKYNRLEK
jgi:L-aminopeptidase/D-esterase-like protein